MERGVVLVYVRSVERQALLYPQALHRRHAVGMEVELLAFLEQVLPENGGLIRWCVELVAELAGIAGAGNDDFDAVYAARSEAEKAQLVEVHTLYYRLEELAREGTLYDRQGYGRGYVGDVSAPAFGVLGDPAIALEAWPGTRHDHEVLVVELVDGYVVYNAAFLVAHGRVP